MKDFLLLLFSIAGGFALSGIAANLYRVLVPKKRRKALLHYSVMVLAGPNVVLGNATASYRRKGCSPLTYGLAVCLTGYWAFALGLFVIAVGMNL
jgi:hypothetical protein